MKEVFNIVNGTRILCAEHANKKIQQVYYECNNTASKTTNLVVNILEGELVHAVLNFSKSWHDSRVANLSELIFLLLKEDSDTLRGMNLLCDSVIFWNRDINEKLIYARKLGEKRDMFYLEETAAIDVILYRVMPCEGQFAEWDIRALKAPFQNLRLSLSSDFEPDDAKSL